MDRNHLAVRAYLARRIIDPEQGVCPEGHKAYLVTGPLGDYSRACAVNHDLGDVIEWWYGQPLISFTATEEAIDAAELAGVDYRLIDWARMTLAEREQIDEVAR